MIVTLTTDFGLRDHFAGAMKGVILGICPAAQVVDITHGVTPFDIAEGAFTIAQAWPCFPRKTVHVVVVDPGVGTARRPILVEAAGHFFIGPDNGVLSLIYQREPSTVRLIRNERLFRHPVSQTFHGRDIFAPVAAHLAAGVPAPQVGDAIQDYFQPDFAAPQLAGPHSWRGRVLKIDHFGNIVTNFRADEVGPLDAPFSLTIAGRTVDTLAATYAETPPRTPFLILGSSGYYEISVPQASAAQLLECSPGAPLDLAVAREPPEGHVNRG